MTHFFSEENPKIGRDPIRVLSYETTVWICTCCDIKKFESTTDDSKTLIERKGSDVDEKNLKDLWEQLGFKVEVHENLKAHEICTTVTNMARKIDETSSCFVCCIMTHGDMDIIYGSDSESLDISYAIHSFKQESCRALADKLVEEAST